jgi:hypothetical protein
MPLCKPSHQFTKSLAGFVGKIPRLFGTRTFVQPAPRIPFVLRLGAAGPLRLGGDRRDLEQAVNAILVALKQYAVVSANPRFCQALFPDAVSPPAQLRLYCQLASGFDQRAVSAGLALGYRLHIVLPGSRNAFAGDIRRNAGRDRLVVAGEEPSTGRFETAADAAVLPVSGQDANGAVDPAKQYQTFLAVADRVLELDRDKEAGGQSEFTHSDYAQAGSIILDHSDVVLVVVHDEPHPALGGTRWIEQRAEERDLPVIRVPAHRPFEALIVWTADGRREHRDLFKEGSRETSPDLLAVALDERVLGPPFKLAKTQPGWLERRMIAQLNPDYNQDLWDGRWKIDGSDVLTKRDLSLVPQQVDADLKPAKTWADHRASAMAELVRGSFILAVFIGLLAVCGALAGALSSDLSKAGKILEVFCLLLIIGLIWRSHRYDWRSQWLSLRQLERYLEQASWLMLLGRERSYGTPSHLTQFQKDDVAKWTNAYFRAVIRNASFPTARLTPDYLKTVHMLVLRNLVVDQISYFESEVPFQRKSDKVLERWTTVCVLTALIATIGYLWLPMTLQQQQLLGDITPGRLVSVLGALLAAGAGALSAIRHHGEYAQIAARFDGAKEALETIKTRLAARLPDRRPDFSPPPLRSAGLASIVGTATDALIQEVQGWRAILQYKEIEPT